MVETVQVRAKDGPYWCTAAHNVFGEVTIAVSKSISTVTSEHKANMGCDDYSLRNPSMWWNVEIGDTGTAKE